jgi:hypothetical protein
LKKLFVLFILISTLWVTGCSKTNLTSFIDPDFKNTTYNKLMVFAIIDDLEMRSKFEKAIVEQFTLNKINAIASIDVFPPTREIKSEELPIILESNQIDGVLQFTIIDANAATKRTQGQTFTTGSGSTYGNNIYYNSSTYSTSYDFNTANLSYELKILDVKSAKIAWMASGTTSGSDEASIKKLTIDELIRSFAKGLILKLQEDKMVPGTTEKG